MDLICGKACAYREGVRFADTFELDDMSLGVHAATGGQRRAGIATTEGVNAPMSSTIAFEPGGYRFVPGPFQYSGGVIAEPGHAIVRARLRTPAPLQAGFERIASHLQANGRPLTAFCACEMRSPAPFSEQGFEAFNRTYARTLAQWGLVDGTRNPVARSNVCPELGPPAEPCFEAFCYTVPRTDGDPGLPSFVVAGSGEAPEGGTSYEAGIVRAGDTSPDGMREKARFVLAEMERRMAALGVSWQHATTTQLYTVFDIHPFLADELVARGATPAGLTWYFARPPVVGLDFEMDLRGLEQELVLDG